jgi:hypothetical protein
MCWIVADQEWLHEQTPASRNASLQVASRLRPTALQCESILHLQLLSATTCMQRISQLQGVYVAGALTYEETLSVIVMAMPRMD